MAGSAEQSTATQAPRLNDLMRRLQHENKAWLDNALEILHQACVEHEEVMTDTIWPLLTWPTTRSGGRLIGKVVREALQRGWMIKMPAAPGHLDCIDHAILPKVHTLDGVLVRHQSAVVVYKSMLFEGPGGPALKDPCEPAHAPRGSGQ